MLEQFAIFQTILDSLKELLSGSASTTTYLILALIPVCITVAIREIWCWFFKQNKLLSRIEKVERQLIKSNQLLEKIGKSLENQKVSSPIPSNDKEFIPINPKEYDRPKDKNPEERTEPKSLGERKFTL